MVEVTDEMVDAALTVYYGSIFMTEHLRPDMRRALVAALSSPARAEREVVAWQSRGPSGVWALDEYGFDSEFRSKSEGLGRRFRPLYTAPPPDRIQAIEAARTQAMNDAIDAVKACSAPEIMGKFVLVGPGGLLAYACNAIRAALSPAPKPVDADLPDEFNEDGSPTYATVEARLRRARAFIKEGGK